MKIFQQLDNAGIRLVQSFDSPIFGKSMALATFMANGSTLFAVCIGAMTISFLLHAWMLVLAFAITLPLMLLYNVAKIIFRRKRRDNPYAALLKSSSFPSGHSADSMATYGLIAFTLLSRAHFPLAILGLIIAILPLAVGISRVYLGAHYPSDVIAGWLIGVLGITLLIRFIPI